MAGAMMMPGGSSGMSGMGGSTAGTGGMDEVAGMDAAGMGGMDDMAGMGGMGGMGGMDGTGMCCSDGDCTCHGEPPSALTNDRGPYATDSYTIAGVGCVYYPTDAEPPFSAIAISDGFLGSGGCGSFQTGQWGPLYASHGIVAMIVSTGSSDQPAQRARALAEGVAAFKEENEDSNSPLSGKLAGRYGTSGFSMGGGGTTIAAREDPTLLVDIAIMPWGPTNTGVTVPTLVICGASDGTASCTSHGTPAYRGIADSVPKMRVQVSGGHNGQPSAGGGESGRVGLGFAKVFLDGDERWRPLLVAADSEDTNIQ
jgi:triacylglycerol lipase